MMICRIYKAFYSFAVFAVLAQIAQIILDARSRSAQTQLGRYGNIEGSRDLKMDDLNKAKQAQYQGGHSAQPSHASSDDVPHGVNDYHDRQGRQQQQQQLYRSESPPRAPQYQAYQPPAGESASYYGSGGAGTGHAQVRMDDFNNAFGPGQHSGAYGSGGYGYQGR